MNTFISCKLFHCIHYNLSIKYPLFAYNMDNLMDINLCVKLVIIVFISTMNHFKTCAFLNEKSRNFDQ